MKTLLTRLIRLYQLLISPLLGPRCRFYPTCSAYAIEAIRTHGAFYGLFLSCKRVLRCHPANPGGYDPVPEKKQGEQHCDCAHTKQTQATQLKDL